MLLVPKIFLGELPKILDLDYLIECSSHHCAKFCDDWPTELRDLATKKNNKNASET